MRLIILGAGPAGLAAAFRARTLGHQATVLDPQGTGGNALRHSLIPSKALIRAIRSLRFAQPLGGQWDPDQWGRVVAWQRRVMARGIQEIEHQLSGIDVVAETGHLTRGSEVILQPSGRSLTADGIIVATGSRQRLLPGMAPDGQRLWLPRILHDLEVIPREVAIIGDGATGLECATLFALLGVRVDLYSRSSERLNERHPVIRSRLDAALRDAGMAIHSECAITRIAAESDGVRFLWTTAEGDQSARHPHVLEAIGGEAVFDPKEVASLGFDVDSAGFFGSMVGDEPIGLG